MRAERDVVIVGVAGVRLRTDHGEHEVSARMVVGADGMFSTIAREVDAPTIRDAPAATISYYAIYDMSGPRNQTDVFAGDRVGGARIPTHDGRTLVGVIWPRDAAEDLLRDLDGSFQQGIEAMPALAEQVDGGRRVGPVAGMRRLPNVVRRSHGPGWALAGDAGYVKDPITAQGIADAFRDAQSLATAIDTGLRGEVELGPALAAHQRQRDAAAAPFFEWTLNNARLTDPTDFFSPENTSAILQRAV